MQLPDTLLVRAGSFPLREKRLAVKMTRAGIETDEHGKSGLIFKEKVLWLKRNTNNLASK